MPIPPAIICQHPVAIDGDTIRCANLPANVRLLGIDAPELHRCSKRRRCTPGNGPAARTALAQLLVRGLVTLQPAGSGGFGRIAARVWAGAIHVNCQMIRTGHAVPRYRQIICPPKL